MEGGDILILHFKCRTALEAVFLKIIVVCVSTTVVVVVVAGGGGAIRPGYGRHRSWGGWTTIVGVGSGRQRSRTTVVDDGVVAGCGVESRPWIDTSRLKKSVKVSKILTSPIMNCLPNIAMKCKAPSATTLV